MQTRSLAGRFGTLALAALALAGCEAQPLGFYDAPKLTADRVAGPYTLYFQPDSDALAPGEAERLNSYLRSLALRPDQDIVLELGKSGSAVLDGRRLLALQRAFAVTRARVRVILPREDAVPETVSNAVRLTVVRYDLIVVECPPLAQPDELTTAMPPLGCANAINRAEMAANKRDLIEPGELRGSEGGVAAAAVLRHREGKVITLPIAVSGG
jgi:type IV pilus biogenesis protein CpaD/CtpE